MNKLKLNVIVPLLLGVVGTLVLMIYPQGHSAFCAGIGAGLL